MNIPWADISSAAQAFGSVAAALIAAYAAFLSRSAAGRSNEASATANAAAAKLAAIESQRRKSELCPRLRVICEPFNLGSDILRLRVMLVGPPGLDRLDRLTVTIRDDHFRRGEHQQIMGGPTADEIKRHIWGPYHFMRFTGPNDARADDTGRTTVYDADLPIGEELPFQLEHTLPGHWMNSMSQEDWLRQRGTVVRIAFTAEHKEYGTWYLPCEIDTATLPVKIYVPQAES
ncbi:hypothetical protein [Planosporangium mesophilum]|uniref:Uncharacterized protein n=1 Tax=Planosporangium mesophilum TaxID=689768 RepID=A0A8J3TQH4_9ACTN|nr:hypothetical protein [Planosporangium mesophilum]NJC82500.1 hypothetical protein [Planosporangium mesophilum]GII25500.1 hypothetical protein Pme01_50970 [Planosporangium mesophilum]